ncbi:hypothetical protein Hypma_000487 [Hypsizygus marmoreus]|uniref:Protein THEM6 n=1 Tax=Hypsizygus marmoreus TaxID=39966 RepID=A0A369JAC5_HYPMA|nr:hypothetical protein Hypma_000487 [Hypsizygus marmoreus]
MVLVPSSSRSTTMSLEKLVGALGPLLTSSLGSFFRLLPTVTKYLLFLVLLINVRSWPLAWHFRVFRPVFRVRIQHKLMKWRTMFKSPAGQIAAEEEWFDSISPIGADPFNYTVKYNSRASIDDSDFNGHLSNSSYAKTLDSARFKTAMAMFPMFFRAGGWMPLAATHYHFIREVPMLAQYEVRVSSGAWDHKWLYVVSKFVTKPSKKHKKSHQEVVQQTTPPADSSSTGDLFHASLRTPADEIYDSSTPSETPALVDTSAPAPDTAKALKAVAASLASEIEPDGATLHTISVSQCCYKIGRITVPPALVLAVNGFSVPQFTAADGSTPVVYSRANPPPHWAKAKAVMSRPHGGSTKALQALLKGGWRDVPEAERWWDVAMGGAVEERRRKGLDVVKSLGLGMGGARAL